MFVLFQIKYPIIRGPEITLRFKIISARDKLTKSVKSLSEKLCGEWYASFSVDQY